jgi:protein-disulfide isomerase
MAKKVEQGGGRRGRPSAVSAAKRGGPGKGFWVALGLVAIIGIAALSWVMTRPKAAVATVDPSLPPMKAQGYVLGSASAPIEVIEFADFECPGCGQFATLTEPDIRTRLINTGQIRMRYLDYPLPMHKNTWDASLAAACANDQGKFWEMHDLIFQNQDKWNGEATGRPRGPLGDLAKQVGLDMTKYEACMDAETHRAQIQGNLAEAERRGIGQTPTFIIGGKVIPGAIPFDQFKALVDAEIAKLPKGAAPAADTGAKKGT